MLTDTDMELRMDTHRPPRRFRRPRLLILMIAAAMLLAAGAAAGAASAGASSSIEGVWSFGGGKIAIQPEGNGKLEGIVVAPTTFAECVHPVEQQIWKEMTLQPDGSYWGFHQWYKSSESEKCALDPAPGPTAWRVIEESNGSHYLGVCLSHPGTTQPTISANGTCTGATYGGEHSLLVSELPTTGTGPSTNGGSGSSGGSGGSGGPGGSSTGGPKESLSLPNSKQCLSVRLFKIHLQEPKYDPFKTVSVTIKGYKHKIATARKGNYIVATINLKGLPKGAFTVQIKATTVLGHTLSASHTYHTCKKKIKKPSKKK